MANTIIGDDKDKDAILKKLKQKLGIGTVRGEV